MPKMSWNTSCTDRVVDAVALRGECKRVVIVTKVPNTFF